MEITKLSESSSKQNPHGVDARLIYSHENAQIVILTLKPGESLKRHITPVDVFFYVLEGKGIVEVGEEKQEVEKDSIVHSPAKILHCWYNESDKPLRIMVAKTPKPKSPQFCYSSALDTISFFRNNNFAMFGWDYDGVCC